MAETKPYFSKTLPFKRRLRKAPLSLNSQLTEANRKVFYRLRHNLRRELVAEANKRIFIQQLERAEKQLWIICKIFPGDTESLIKLVEVKTKQGNFKDTKLKLESLLREHPTRTSLKLADLLFRIRQVEDEESRIPDQSLEEGIRDEVVALSFQEEMALLPAMGSQTSNLKTYISTENYHSRATQVERATPASPDDAPFEDKPITLNSSHDGIKMGEDSGAHVVQKNKILAEIREMRSRNSQNAYYSFVVGCSQELMGNLSGAIESWLQGFQLNSECLPILHALSELQQMGALPNYDIDYSKLYERADRFLIHGTLDTHMDLFNEFLDRNEMNSAITALRTLSDWFQKHRGEVPIEIEILSLLGAYKAYGINNQTAAAQACYQDIDDLSSASCKCFRDETQLCFIAQNCENFGLPQIAVKCYVTLLESQTITEEFKIQIAAHCVSKPEMISEDVASALHKAYQDSHGQSELGFCALLSTLQVSNVDIETYLDRKTTIRSLMKQGDIGECFPLLIKALDESTQDPEIHYLLGDIYRKLGADEKAYGHYRQMLSLDSFQPQFILSYLQFLCDNKEYEHVLTFVDNKIEHLKVPDTDLSDLLWIASIAAKELENTKKATQLCKKALSYKPWEFKLLVHSIGILGVKPKDDGTRGAPVAILRDLAKQPHENTKKVTKEFIARVVNHIEVSLDKGYTEYCYLLGKTLFLLAPNNNEVQKLYFETCAAWDARLGVQQLLLLREAELPFEIPFAHIASFAVQIYSMAGEWALVDEWSDIAKKSGLKDQLLSSKLLEIEALRLALSGKNLSRAQTLLEAAFDSYDTNKESIPEAAGMLLGYLMVTQGEIKKGLAKMQEYASESKNIQSLYFYVKGLHRAGDLVKKDNKNTLKRLLSLSPKNTLEQKFIEEIHCTMGKIEKRRGSSLIC